LEKRFNLEYWIDDDWYVGRIKEVPGVFSQGANIEELEENIRDAYRIVMSEQDEYIPASEIKRKELSLSL
jgi:predicted RNase H-like HicB family nuclease